MTTPNLNDMEIAVIEEWSGNPPGTVPINYIVTYRTFHARRKIEIQFSAGRNRELADQLCDAINLTNWVEISDVTDAPVG